MFIPRLYYPHPLHENDLLTLDKDHSHHLITVLRLENGEKIVLFNGQGGEFSAELFISKKSAQIKIGNYIDVNRESTLQTHLAQGLSRGDRMDYVIQKATECGVTTITPLFTELCAVKLDHERSEKRMLHWQNIAISAAEQSGRTQVPIIYPPMPLRDWIMQPFNGFSLLFELDESQAIKDLSPMQKVRIAIGPESGWSQNEVDLMKKHEFVACTLGKRILRTETAPVVALSLLQGLFGS